MIYGNERRSLTIEKIFKKNMYYEIMWKIIKTIAQAGSSFIILIKLR